MQAAQPFTAGRLPALKSAATSKRAIKTRIVSKASPDGSENQVSFCLPGVKRPSSPLSAFEASSLNISAQIQGYHFWIPIPSIESPPSCSSTPTAPGVGVQRTTFFMIQMHHCLDGCFAPKPFFAWLTPI